MSNFNNNCFVINIKVQLSNYFQQIGQSLIESKWLVSRLSRGGGGGGGGAHEKGKALGTNRILTKKILTCLFKKKGLFSINKLTSVFHASLL